MRKTLQFVALFLLLVVFPLGSWYYLKMGLKYRRENLQELQDLGKQPLPAVPDVFLGTPLPSDSLQGRWVVTGFVDLSLNSQAASFATKLESLHEQFDERKEVFFLTYVQADSSQLLGWLQNYKFFKDQTQCRFAIGNAQQVEAAALALGLPKEWSGNTWMTLADEKQTLRRRYNIDQEEELKSLVKHIAILIPTITRDSPMLKREKEK